MSDFSACFDPLRSCIYCNSATDLVILAIFIDAFMLSGQDRKCIACRGYIHAPCVVQTEVSHSRVSAMARTKCREMLQFD